MKLKNVAVLGVCGAFLCTVALDQVKYTSFSAIGAGTSENSDVDGVGKLKMKNSGELSVHANVSGLAADTSYRVFLGGGDLEISFGGDSMLVTNHRGHGNFQADSQIGSLTLTGSETITLWIDDNGDNVMADSEKRAVSGL
jgi:hypothetical protein